MTNSFPRAASSFPRIALPALSNTPHHPTLTPPGTEGLVLTASGRPDNKKTAGRTEQVYGPITRTAPAGGVLRSRTSRLPPVEEAGYRAMCRSSEAAVAVR